jgi:hypothetical protein
LKTVRLESTERRSDKALRHLRDVPRTVIVCGLFEPSISQDTRGDENGQRWADVIDFLTMYPEARRRVARVLGEIEFSS